MSHTVLIVDDNALVRHAMRSYIEQHTDSRVCGEAADGGLALERFNTLHPSIVILDFQMPVMNGLEVARLISRVAPDAVIILFTMHSSEYLLKESHAAGIRHVVSKAAGVTNGLLPILRDLRGMFSGG